jgi:hypothetical protein
VTSWWPARSCTRRFAIPTAGSTRPSRRQRTNRQLPTQTPPDALSQAQFSHLTVLGLTDAEVREAGLEAVRKMRALLEAEKVEHIVLRGERGVETIEDRVDADGHLQLSAAKALATSIGLNPSRNAPASAPGSGLTINIIERIDRQPPVVIDVTSQPVAATTTPPAAIAAHPPSIVEKIDR